MVASKSYWLDRNVELSSSSRAFVGISHASAVVVEIEEVVVGSILQPTVDWHLVVSHIVVLTTSLSEVETSAVAVCDCSKFR